MGTAVEEQRLTAEDQLLILMQAAAYLTTREMGSPEARICYERAEFLCHSLGSPLLLYVALIGQWRYSFMADKLSTAMRIAERVYSLAQEQDDPRLMIGAYHALTATLYNRGDFECARQHAMRGLQIWRSGAVRSPVEEVSTPGVICLVYSALTDWHLGEIAFCQATIAEAISRANELNDMYASATALFWAAVLAYCERNPAKVERYASDLSELSTRQNFAFWLAGASILRGWACTVSGATAEGVSRIEDGIDDWRVTGGILGVPLFLALKAEALHLAHRTSEALEAIKEAEALVERSEDRWWCAELHRLRGVFLAALGAEESKIEAAFCTAIRIAKEQKSISLEKRAEATDAEYRRQKASGSGGGRFRLPLC